MQSPATLHAKRRVLDRRRRHGATRVISEMSRSAALHLAFTKSGSNFVPSNGTPSVHRHRAARGERLPVVPVNDGLFPGTPQTWRWAEA